MSDMAAGKDLGTVTVIVEAAITMTGQETTEIGAEMEPTDTETTKTVPVVTAIGTVLTDIVTEIATVMIAIAIQVTQNTAVAAIVIRNMETRMAGDLLLEVEVC